MRLWHEKLLPHLSKQWLLGQHRECCALRGRGWGKKHSTVDYVFKYHISRIVGYHLKVIKQLEKMNVNIDKNWKNCFYRGKLVGFDPSLSNIEVDFNYSEHDDNYLKQCLENLFFKMKQGKKPFRENDFEIR